MNSLITLGYLGMFIAAFLAGSIVPFSSELVMTALLAQTDLNTWWLLAAATLGNWLGEMTCFGIGRLGKLAWIEKWTHIKPETLNKWERRLKKYGGWLTFFSFVPGLGNLLAVGAGYFRCSVTISSLMMLLGKLIRYLLIIGGMGLITLL